LVPGTKRPRVVRGAVGGTRVGCHGPGQSPV